MAEKLKAKRICIVACAIEGLTYRSGVGVAVRAIAEELALAGFQVDILYCGNIGGADEVLFPVVQLELLHKGIRLLPLKIDLTTNPNPNKEVLRRSRDIFNFLEFQNYSFVHFTDSVGLAFYSTFAKNQGWALNKSVLCMTLHAPLAWLYSFQSPRAAENRKFCFEMERYAFANTDVLIGVSKFATDLICQYGVQPKGELLVLAPPSPRYKTLPRNRNEETVKEIVFFGCLERRKGLEEFCQAINLIQENAQLPKLKVTFLGSDGTIGRLSGQAYISKHLRYLKGPVNVYSELDRESALRYLHRKNILVVLASKSETYGYTLRECLDLGIPFICSDIPAFRELVPRQFARGSFYGSTASELAAFIQDKILQTNSLQIPPVFRRQKKVWAFWHRKHRFTKKKGIIPNVSCAFSPTLLLGVQKLSRTGPPSAISTEPLQILSEPLVGQMEAKPKVKQISIKSAADRFHKMNENDRWTVFPLPASGRINFNILVQATTTQILFDLAVEKVGAIELFELTSCGRRKVGRRHSFVAQPGRFLYWMNIEPTQMRKQKINVEFTRSTGAVGVRKVWELNKSAR